MYKPALAIVLQVVLGYVFGFMLPYASGIGNGLELIAIPTGMTAGIILGGLIIRSFSAPALFVTLAGSFVGAAILLIPGIAFGFIGILLPLLGGLLGFYGFRSK